MQVTFPIDYILYYNVIKTIIRYRERPNSTCCKSIWSKTATNTTLSKHYNFSHIGHHIVYKDIRRNLHTKLITCYELALAIHFINTWYVTNTLECYANKLMQHQYITYLFCQCICWYSLFLSLSLMWHSQRPSKMRITWIYQNFLNCLSVT